MHLLSRQLEQKQGSARRRKKKLVVRAAATKQLSEGRKRLGTKHKIAGRRAAGPNLPTTHKAEYQAQHSNVRSARRVAGVFFLYSTNSPGQLLTHTLLSDALATFE